MSCQIQPFGNIVDSASSTNCNSQDACHNCGARCYCWSPYCLCPSFRQRLQFEGAVCGCLGHRLLVLPHRSWCVFWGATDSCCTLCTVCWPSQTMINAAGSQAALGKLRRPCNCGLQCARELSVISHSRSACFRALFASVCSLSSSFQ